MLRSAREATARSTDGKAARCAADCARAYERNHCRRGPLAELRRAQRELTILTWRPRNAQHGASSMCTGRAAVWCWWRPQSYGETGHGPKLGASLLVHLPHWPNTRSYCSVVQLHGQPRAQPCVALCSQQATTRCPAQPTRTETALAAQLLIQAHMKEEATDCIPQHQPRMHA